MTRVEVFPHHHGFAPIATCHWQNLANLLLQQGHQNALENMCFSWGFAVRPGAGELYGSNRWLDLTSRCFGVIIHREQFHTWELACQREKTLLQQGHAVVCEVDAFFLPSPYQNKQHVVHTLTVLSHHPTEVQVLDCTNLRAVQTFTTEQHACYRSHPCEGRIDPWVLYWVEPQHHRLPSPETTLQLAIDDARAHLQNDLQAAHTYLSWAQDHHQVLNVCRVAAERHAFHFFLNQWPEQFGELLPELKTLTEQWFLLHLLTEHEHVENQRHRKRILTLLHTLVTQDFALRNRWLNQCTMQELTR